MKINSIPTIKTINKEGGGAYDLPLKERFVSQLMTSLYREPKFYGDNTDDLIRDAKELIGKEPAFVAKAAIYARNVMQLRTIPTVMCGLLALDAKGRPLVRRTINMVCTRPDQLTELVAFLEQGNTFSLAKKIKQVRLALADVLGTFDEHRLAKYNRAGKVKLRDILLISHAKPIDAEQAALWKRLLDDKLEVPITWETQVSGKGNTAEVWDALIAEKKLPYMAALRNLRNIIESGATKLDDILAMIANPEAVKRSRQLPFRFYTAYRELSGIPTARPALKAISDALTYSIANLPEIGGLTMIAADNSGSMQSPLSSMGKANYIDVANLMSALMARLSKNAITSVFGEQFAIVTDDGISSPIAIAERFASTQVGSSTNGWLVPDWLMKQGLKVDRVIFFTDCQLWNSRQGYNRPADLQKFWSAYKKIAPDAWLHIVDLNGSGTTPAVLQGKVNLIAGWSENVLSFIKTVEEGTGSPIDAIEGVEL